MTSNDSHEIHGDSLSAKGWKRISSVCMPADTITPRPTEFTRRMGTSVPSSDARHPSANASSSTKSRDPGATNSKRTRSGSHFAGLTSTIAPGPPSKTSPVGSVPEVRWPRTSISPAVTITAGRSSAAASAAGSAPGPTMRAPVVRNARGNLRVTDRTAASGSSLTRASRPEAIPLLAQRRRRLRGARARSQPVASASATPSASYDAAIRWAGSASSSP